MMNFNNFLFAISLIMAFELSWNGVNSDKDTCPIQFPEGFFCDLVCKKWGILTGNTIRCFISNQGGYQRFIARNPAFGIWRFYKVDTSSHVESLCENSVTGDEFYLNDTDIMCATPIPKTKRYYSHKARSSKFRFDNSAPSIRSENDVNVPMDAICELATTQLCRQGKVISCVDRGSCCYEKVPNGTCEEDTMSQFSDCYKVLYSVLSNLLY